MARAASSGGNAVAWTLTPRPTIRLEHLAPAELPLDEHARELAAAREHVVGPLHRDDRPIADARREHVGHGDADRQGDRREARRRDARADHEREVEVLARAASATCDRLARAPRSAPRRGTPRRRALPLTRRPWRHRWWTPSTRRPDRHAAPRRRARWPGRSTPRRDRSQREVQRDVRGRRRVGERADADQIDPGRGELGDRAAG